MEPHKKELLKSLVLARLEMKEIKAEHNYTKGTGTIKYANINDILDYIIPILLRHGIWLEFELNAVYNLGEQLMFIRLTHIETGQSRESSVIIPNQPTDQLFGASVSYRERYALISLLALPINKDDDGESQSQSIGTNQVQSSSSNQQQSSSGFTQKKPMQGLATEGQVGAISRYLKNDKPFSDQLLGKYTLLTNVPKQLASDIIDAFKNNKPMPNIGEKQQQPINNEEINESEYEEVNEGLPF